MKNIEKIKQAIENIARVEAWLIRLRRQKIHFVKGFDGIVPTDINRSTNLIRGLDIEQRLNEYKLSLLIDQILFKKKNPLTEEIIIKAEFGVTGHEKIPTDNDIMIEVLNHGKRAVYRVGQHPIIDQESIPSPVQTSQSVSISEQKKTDAIIRLFATIHKTLANDVNIVRNIQKAIFRIKSERKRIQGRIDRAVLKNDRKWARYIIKYYKQTTPKIIQLANSNKRRPRTKKHKLIQL